MGVAVQGENLLAHKQQHNVNILKTKRLASVTLNAVAQSEVGFNDGQGS